MPKIMRPGKGGKPGKGSLSTNNTNTNTGKHCDKDSKYRK